MTLASCLRIWILVASLLALMPIAQADGMFAKMGSLEPANIPRQRAVIAYRNGVETMVVESVLAADEAEYAWIVPVPSRPTATFVADPMGFDSNLRRTQQPRVEGLGMGESVTRNLIWALLPLAILSAAAAAVGRQEILRQATQWKLGLAMAFLLLAAGIVFAPVYAYSGAKSAAAGSVQWMGADLAGDYKVHFVQSKDPKALSRWLKQWGGKLSPEAEKSVAEYVREGWCFAVAKVHPSRKGDFLPMPLGLQFATSKPVYPMRLTGTQPKDLLLEVYVLADGTAKVGPLRNWGSVAAPTHSIPTPVKNSGTIYSPIRELAWNGAMTTRLRKVVSAREMQRDYPIEIGPAQPSRLVVMRSNALAERRQWGAVQCAGFAAMLCGLLSVLFAMPAWLRWGGLVLICGGAAFVGWMEPARGFTEIEPGLYARV